MAVFLAGSGQAEERVAFLARTAPYWQVWLMNADGSDQTQLTHSESEKARVSWYPDGRHLLVVELSERLLKVDADTGEETSLEIELQGVHDAQISPDGAWLAVSANPAGGRDAHDIWLLTAEGRNPRRLAGMPYLQHGPRWSADGAWVYFLSGDGKQDHDIWRVNVESGRREQITVGTRYHFELDVSPENVLAFSSNRTGDYEIYAQAPGGKPVRWTETPGLDGHPSWSPRGDALIFHSARGGIRPNLWLREGPDAPARRLTDFAEGARAPEWWGPAQ